MLFLSWLLTPAQACSMIFTPGERVSPQEGTVPPGFAVRYELAFGNAPRLVNAEDEEFMLMSGDDGQFFAPLDLEPGEYTLADWDSEVALQVDDIELVTPAWEPAIAEVSHEVRLVAEQVTASCLEVHRRRHTFTTVTLEIPPGENGWAVQVRDGDRVQWLPVSDESTVLDVTWDAGRVGDVEQSCIDLALVNPLGEVVWSEESPCVDAGAGCSTTTGGGGLLLGLLALFGNLRRRRRA